MLNTQLVKQITELLKTVLIFNEPTDRLLTNFFRDHKQLASNDRFIVAETIYSVLRNYFKLNHPLTLAGLQATPQVLVTLALTKLLYLNEETELTCLSNIPGIATLRELTLDPKIVELPPWLYEQLITQMSEHEISQLSASFSKVAPLDLRVNILKTKATDIIKELDGAIPCKYSPFGIRLDNKIPLSKHQLFKSGAIEVQDESSQLAGLLLNPKRGEWIVDFCAGSGGKTLLIGMLMRNTGRIYAFDNNSKRLNNLTPRLARSGLSNIHPQLINDEHDSKLKRLFGKIDRVFVDAPCSGLGTIRRNPDIKFRQSSQSITELNTKQLSILGSASRLVKSGGYLLYATCSILKVENQDIVTKFLETHKDFKLVPAASILDKPPLNSDYLVLMPHIHRTDGFFAALMQKT